MKHVIRLAQMSAAIAAIGLVMPRRSLAYIDPGTGSYMLQMLIALAVGGAFAVKLFWRRIVGFFRRRSSPSSQSRPTDGETLRSAAQPRPTESMAEPASAEHKKEDAV